MKLALLAIAAVCFVVGYVVFGTVSLVSMFTGPSGGHPALASDAALANSLAASNTSPDSMNYALSKLEGQEKAAAPAALAEKDRDTRFDPHRIDGDPSLLDNGPPADFASYLDELARGPDAAMSAAERILDTPAAPAGEGAPGGADQRRASAIQSLLSHVGAGGGPNDNAMRALAQRYLTGPQARSGGDDPGAYAAQNLWLAVSRDQAEGLSGTLLGIENISNAETRRLMVEQYLDRYPGAMADLSRALSERKLTIQLPEERRAAQAAAAKAAAEKEAAEKATAPSADAGNSAPDQNH